MLNNLLCHTGFHRWETYMAIRDVWTSTGEKLPFSLLLGDCTRCGKVSPTARAEEEDFWDWVAEMGLDIESIETYRLEHYPVEESV